MHNLMVCSGGSFLYDVVIHDVFDLFVKRLTNELHVQTIYSIHPNSCRIPGDVAAAEHCESVMNWPHRPMLKQCRSVIGSYDRMAL